MTLKPPIQSFSTFRRSSSRASYFCITTCLALLAVQQGLGLVFFCGFRPTNRSSRTLLKAVLDRPSALRKLGFDGSKADPPADDIKRAFRQAALESHPDRPGGDAKRFQEVKQAYEILTGRIDPAPSGPLRGKPPRWAQTPRWPQRRSRVEYEEEDDIPGDWKTWSKNGQNNFEDMDDVWNDIGYNPYKSKQAPPKAQSAPRQPQSPPPTSAERMAKKPSWQLAVEVGALVIFAVLVIWQASILETYKNASEEVDEAAPQRTEIAVPEPEAFAGTEQQQQQLQDTGPFIEELLPQRQVLLPPTLSTGGGLEYLLAGKASESSQVIFSKTPVSRFLRTDRILELASSITTALENARTKIGNRKIVSMVVVAYERDVRDLLDYLQQQGILKDFEVPEYGFFSQRAIIRFTQMATSGGNQPVLDLLFVGSRGFSPDVDEDPSLSELKQALGEERPDVVLMDIPEKVWRKLNSQ